MIKVGLAMDGVHPKLKAFQINNHDWLVKGHHHFWANPSMWLKWRYHIIASNIGNNSHYIISLHNWFRPFYVLYFYTTVFWMNEWMPLCAHPQLWKDDRLDLPTQSMKHMTNTNSSSRLVLLYENTKYTYIYVWGKSIYIYIYIICNFM